MELYVADILYIGVGPVLSLQEQRLLIGLFSSECSGLTELYFRPDCEFWLIFLTIVTLSKIL